MKTHHAVAHAFVLVAVSLSLGACRGSSTPEIDWERPESFFIVDKSERTEDGVNLEFHFLIDAPAAGVYKALAGVEHYASFIPGVQKSVLVSSTASTKTIDIAQTVIGVQNRAQVVWTLDRKNRTVSFETVRSDGSMNNGNYHVYSSPDGRRCYVVAKFDVHQTGLARAAPIGLLAKSIRDSVGEAAKAIKQRALTAG